MSENHSQGQGQVAVEENLVWEETGDDSGEQAGMGSGNGHPHVGALDPLDGIEAERIVAPRATITRGREAANVPGQPTQQPLYLDLETAPDEERMELFDLPPLPEVPPVATSANCPEPAAMLSLSIDRMKTELSRLNPEDAYLELLAAEEAKAAKPRSGIADACKSQRAARRAVAEAEGERRKLLSVTPEFCRIVAVGWAVGGESPQSILVGQDGAAGQAWDERLILRHVWELIRKHSPIVGFNVLGFDLSVIRARSVILCVEPSKIINDSPWNNRDVTDLMAARFGRSGKAMKLKALARLYGIPVPAGDVDGSDVQRLLANDPAKLGEYVRSDVAITRELHRKWSGFFCV